MRVFSFRFFETESIAVITMMMLKYRVEVKQEPEFAGETLEQCFARITASEQKLTNTYAIMSSLSCLPQPEFSQPQSRAAGIQEAIAICLNLNCSRIRHFIGRVLLYTHCIVRIAIVIIKADV
jgi:hypothetical protein